MREAGPINGWLDLAKLIQEYADGHWIFRGEEEEFPTLRPKAGREGSYVGAARKKPYSFTDEKQAFVRFKKEARPHVGFEPRSDAEWLAVAQHHGCPTRFLDWTESMLIAAYFAVVNAGAAGKKGVLYAIRDLPELTEPDEAMPFDVNTVCVYRPPHLSARIPAQRSLFTLHPNPTQDYRTEASSSLRYWTIAPEACGQIKHILDASGINEGSLFPDLDGRSRGIAWRYKWGK